MKAPSTPILEKMADYLARRDHSIYELKQKLKRLHYEDSDIERAIQYAEDQNWLIPPDELAAKVAQRLHEQHKGEFYIQQYLKSKGLPGVSIDDEVECEKALSFIQKRGVSFTERDKIARRLQNRGFSSATIRFVLSHIREHTRELEE